MWHRTNMQKRQQMPEAQPVDALDQPDPYRGGTPGDQKTAVDKIPVPQFPQIKPLAERCLEGPFQARIVLITGGSLGNIAVCCGAACGEIFDMGGVLLSCRVGLRDPISCRNPKQYGLALRPSWATYPNNTRPDSRRFGRRNSSSGRSSHRAQRPRCPSPGSAAAEIDQR